MAIWETVMCAEILRGLLTNFSCAHPGTRLSCVLTQFAVTDPGTNLSCVITRVSVTDPGKHFLVSTKGFRPDSEGSGYNDKDKLEDP